MTNDPTFQTSGGLLVTVRNEISFTERYDSKWYGMPVNPNEPQYLPAGSPPPSWTKGRDYFPNPGTAYVFRSVLPINDSTSGLLEAQSAYPPMWIADMSAQAVRTGKQYFCTVDTPLWYQFPTVRLLWIITGVEGGSTLLPGFGLYNLSGENRLPNTWTYVTPSAFTGKYSIELANPYYSEIVTLSVSYVPRRQVFFVKDPHEMARLNFSIDGSLCRSIQPSATSEAQEPIEQEILTPPSMYKIVSDPVE